MKKIIEKIILIFWTILYLKIIYPKYINTKLDITFNISFNKSISGIICSVKNKPMIIPNDIQHLNILLNFKNTNTNGLSMNISTRSKPAVLSVKASQCSFARHFGITSPNVRTKRVVAPVAIAEPISPKRLRQSTVAIDEQLKFTMLLQIRIVVRALSKFSIT